MAISPNGSENFFGFNGVSTTGALTNAIGGTLQSAALMFAQVIFTTTSITPVTVSSITDSQGNTWTRLTSQEAHSGWDTSQTVNGAQKSFTQEVWYTKAATIGTSIDITVAFSGTIDSGVLLTSPKYIGYDATNPFDANASLPKQLRVNAAAQETVTGISTTNGHIYPVWFFGAWGTNLGVSNVQFNGINRNEQTSLQHNASEFVKAQFAAGPAAVAAYSGVSFGPALQSASNYFINAIVMTADAGPAPAPPISRVMIIG